MIDSTLFERIIEETTETMPKLGQLKAYDWHPIRREWKYSLHACETRPISSGGV